MERLALTVSEAAQALGVSNKFVYQLIKQKSIPALHVGERRLLIPCDGLRAWLNAGATTTSGN